MNYQKFINQIVERGIKAAKRDYKRPGQKAILKGSIAGFKACLGKNVLELSKLLDEARKKGSKLYTRKANLNKKEQGEYWESRGYILEIEWVCNVVSAALMNEGKSVIIQPTARGTITASEILGVAK